MEVKKSGPSLSASPVGRERPRNDDPSSCVHEGNEEGCEVCLQDFCLSCSGVVCAHTYNYGADLGVAGEDAWESTLNVKDPRSGEAVNLAGTAW